MTSVVAFSYLSYEKMDNFEWALSKVKGLFVKDDLLSKIIVSYKNRVFMSAKCKIHVDKAEEWQNVMDAWEILF